MNEGSIKDLERGEYDGYQMHPMPNTPENRKKAAQARKEAVKYAKKLKKKYGLK